MILCFVTRLSVMLVYAPCGFIPRAILITRGYHLVSPWVGWCHGLVHGRGLWLTLSCVDSGRGDACPDPAVGVPFGPLYVTAPVACPLRC